MTSLASLIAEYGQRPYLIEVSIWADSRGQAFYAHRGLVPARAGGDWIDAEYGAYPDPPAEADALAAAWAWYAAEAGYQAYLADRPEKEHAASDGYWYGPFRGCRVLSLVALDPERYEYRRAYPSRAERGAAWRHDEHCCAGPAGPRPGCPGHYGWVPAPPAGMVLDWGSAAEDETVEPGSERRAAILSSFAGLVPEAPSSGRY